MSRTNTNTKRQLLADLFEGKTDSLQTYRCHKQRQDSPIRLVIDARATDGTIIAEDKQGNKILMSEQDLLQLNPSPSIWIITDYTGGRPLPGIDE